MTKNYLYSISTPKTQLVPQIKWAKNLDPRERWPNLRHSFMSHCFDESRRQSQDCHCHPKGTLSFQTEAFRTQKRSKYPFQRAMDGVLWGLLNLWDIWYSRDLAVWCLSCCCGHWSFCPTWLRPRSVRPCTSWIRFFSVKLGRAP